MAHGSNTDSIPGNLAHIRFTLKGQEYIFGEQLFSGSSVYRLQCIDAAGKRINLMGLGKLIPNGAPYQPEWEVARQEGYTIVLLDLKDGRHIIVMQNLGPDLFTYLKKREKLNLKQILRLMLAILKKADKFSKNIKPYGPGRVHGDLKFENMIKAKDIHFIDFGSTKSTIALSTTVCYL